ncbi:MAG: hypothetical protein LC130_08845 [Bryobacterales bacterium]|nr:hypothetical protein [Bryobacterales bacterium]
MGRADAEGQQKTKKRPQPNNQRTRSGGKQGSAKRVVDVAIRKIGAKLSSEDVKATVGDFIRLLQLQKELDEEGAKEIKVTWVEPTEMESVSEE